MFDIGWQELVVIVTVGIIVIGPKDLPRVLSQAARYMRKARTIAREFQGSIDEIVRQAELDDIRKEVEKVSKVDVENEIRNAVDPTGEISRNLDMSGVQSDLEQTTAALTGGAEESAKAAAPEAASPELPPPEAVAPEGAPSEAEAPEAIPPEPAPLEPTSPEPTPSEAAAPEAIPPEPAPLEPTPPEPAPSEAAAPEATPPEPAPPDDAGKAAASRIPSAPPEPASVEADAAPTEARPNDPAHPASG